MVSIHKMQGSESKLIIMPIHNCFKKMLDKCLLYTGLSRAKERLMIFGDIYALKLGTSQDFSSNRLSFISHRLEDSKLDYYLTKKN